MCFLGRQEFILYFAGYGLLGDKYCLDIEFLQQAFLLITLKLEFVRPETLCVYLVYGKLASLIVGERIQCLIILKTIFKIQYRWTCQS